MSVEPSGEPEPVEADSYELGGVVISEILFNPKNVYDSRGEWFELHNTTDAVADLSGWTIGDETYDVHTISSLTIEPGDRAVLARFGDATRNGGVDADYVYGDAVLLFNVGDRIVVRNADGYVVDDVNYADTSFTRPAGRSLSLIDSSADNANGVNWCVATTTMSAGDFGSPGRANECGESNADLVITEVLSNPQASGDFTGEWFELLNVGDAVELDGFTIQDEDGDSFTLDQVLNVASGERVVFGTNADTSANGGVDIDVDYGDALRLHNTFDELVVNDANGIQVDRVRWDDGRTFPDLDGASMQLNDPAADNSDGANWCASARRWADGDFGTPGAAGDCDAQPLPDIVITEIMYDPERISPERDGEWFELANVGELPAVLDGFTFRTRSTTYTVESLTIPANRRAIFASNGDVSENGGVAADHAYGDSLPLYNTSTVLELLSPDGDLIDRVEYSVAFGFPMESGHSMELRSVDADNSLGANWCASTDLYGAGDFGTPGIIGACDEPEAPAPLLISEVMRNPATVWDSIGEWFEIYNPTADPVDLFNWSIGDNGSEHFVIRDHVTVDPNGFVVVGRSSDTSVNGGVEVDLALGGAMTLIDSADEIVLSDSYGQPVDELVWDSTSLMPRPNGGSIARTMSAMLAFAENTDVSEWCVTGTQYGAGDRGTPGLANDCVPTPNHVVVINEIHRDPQAEPDARGEWIELHNSGGDAIDISGWTLRDDDVDTWSFPTGAPIMIDAGGYLTAGRNAANINGGIDLDVLYGSEIVLFNTADELMLLDRELTVVDRVAWTAENGFPKVKGSSMSLRDATLDNAVGSNWCAGVTDQGNGDLATPGAANLCEVPPEPDPYPPTLLTHSIFATGNAVCQAEVRLNGSDIFVGKAVRSNNNISVNGSSMVIGEQISHGGSAQLGWGIVTNGVVHEPAAQAVPFGWSLNDFAPGGQRAVDAGDAYFSYVGDLDLDGNGVNLAAGVHYVAGNVDIDASKALLNEITIVATGTISISASQVSLTSFADDLPALFSGHDACTEQGITLSTSNLTVSGALFAPDSIVKASASVVTVTEGSFVGSSVQVSGSRLSFDRRSGFVRVTAMCLGSGENAGLYKFRVRHEGDSSGLFPFDLRKGGLVKYSGVISAGEVQHIWLPSNSKGIKAIATGGWSNEYADTASANNTPC